MTIRQLSTAAAVTLAAAALNACGGGDGETAASTPAPAEGATVNTKVFQFQPDPLTVKAGTKVTFKNLDGTVHTVVGGTREKADKSLIDGSMAKSTGTYEVTFDKAGTYPYFCDLHSGDGMVGEIVVQ